MTTPMKPSEILDKAADVIERNGWVKGSFAMVIPGMEPRDYPCCVMGAINIAESGTPYCLVVGKAHQALGDHLGVNWDGWPTEIGDTPISQWNDAQDRTCDEVLRELRAAAASEREAGR